MGNGYFVNARKSYAQRKIEGTMTSHIFDTKAARIESENARIKKANKKPALGPRTLLMHYIFDLNMPESKAIEKILEQYTALSREDVLNWIEEEKEKKKYINSKEQNNGR